MPFWPLGLALFKASTRAVRFSLSASTVKLARPIVHKGELLSVHVRFEERTLFPLLERRLSAAALADLGRALASAEAGD